jgi:hypothetical protein
MAGHVGGATSCPRCPCASLFAGIGPASGQWQNRADPADPVPGSPGNLWRGCERWRCGSDFQGRTVSVACSAREYGHRLRQAGSSAACPARSSTSLANEMQLDLTGHDPKPASRGPGTLRDYGRHTDRTWFSPCVEWNISRSATIPMGRNGRAVKPLTSPGRATASTCEYLLENLSTRMDDSSKIIPGGNSGANRSLQGLIWARPR